MRVATQTWKWPVALGLGAAAAQWVVWYFTKSPCTIENALDGVCNAGAVAQYIDHQILAQAILLGLAVAAVKGGYDEIMVSRERKRADDAEARLEEERKRSEEMRKQLDALHAERQAELEAERAELQAERALERAERQAVLNNLVQINNALTQLLAERQNGRSSAEN
ncbi:MAG: hypothetical protein OXL37_00590 [Chloroflexota bacterium]|nr:hypothetical protein [Chloroflexota bacterium]MDE2959063.1 hypothetical protein [Chloroflexota bacterium]